MLADLGVVRARPEREAALQKESKRGQGVHWILQQRPVTGSLEATKDQLRGEAMKKKIDGYLILEEGWRFAPRGDDEPEPRALPCASCLVPFAFDLLPWRDQDRHLACAALGAGVAPRPLA